MVCYRYALLSSHGRAKGGLALACSRALGAVRSLRREIRASPTRHKAVDLPDNQNRSTWERSEWLERDDDRGYSYR